MAAVVLACASAVLFGGMSVALRLALDRNADSEGGSLITVTTASAICLLLSFVDSGGGSLAPRRLLPFVLLGLLSPGVAQILFTRAVREAGSSRVSVAVGAAPLVSVTIALLFLGEPARAPLLVGALLIVVGGLALIREPRRPDAFRWIGIAIASLGTVMFSTRDTLVRALAVHTKVNPLPAAAATLLAGLTVALAFLAVTRGRHALAGLGARSMRGFFVAGTLFGLSYACLFEAYYRGRVTVVSPLVATESLFGVLFSVLLLRRSELVGRHLILGAILIVAGGALIGATR
jgi:drug/metabolite transporter (DMT)-like permease